MSCGYKRSSRCRRECRNLYSRKSGPSSYEHTRCCLSPVVVAPPTTDAQVNAGTILGITSMFARGRY